ncbi:hypothetical protein F5B22DRAFT_641275 [Xylaria bambusicola]|uniref:uncharacterized protein n=1 Tax=Xylaria bambusicola TaxID=326684 RepID=UPI002007A0CF|nr:uncharacterized protein F5B22DRAFT_641275 [Xylaria bambusicola]KAI0528303.1 hypothetical protein F5B22DRAFT_641275 [Xylaria bambusicola]
MGLPLFIPPVESDVSSKPSTKSRSDPAHARSSIRRNERRRQLNETREQHRLRLVNAMQATDSALTALQSPSETRSFPHQADTPRASARTSALQIPSAEDARSSAQPDIAEILDRLTRSNMPRSSAIYDLDDAWNQLGYMMPSDFPSIQSSSTSRPNALPTTSRHGLPHTTRRTNLRRGIDRNSEEPRPRRPRYAERDFDRLLAIRDAERRSRHATSMNTIAARQHRHAQRARYVDGLGDRDRSLSPEGDGVWDTLQSTLTPDPQPPSVGSSFASAISANTSDSNGATSVNTSMTTPNEEVEPPCDPVVDNPGSDGEDDVEERPSRQTTPRDWRSYADVLAEAQSGQSNESADAGDTEREWLSGMHRIVAGLASRVDIPDEWWAQAGLSRSMSWEDSI